MSDDNYTGRYGYGPVPPGSRPWVLMWVYYLHAVEDGEHSQRLKDELAEEVGDTFAGFVQAVSRGLLVISTELRDTGVTYVVSVNVSDGLAPLMKIHASRVGLGDPETLALETAWAAKSHGPRLN